MSALTREEKLTWLKSAGRSGRECRVLCNVRCLSEGVDVPSLDAVLFLSQTPDYRLPATSPILQEHLGLPNAVSSASTTA